MLDLKDAAVSPASESDVATHPVDGLDLDTYYLFHAIRANLLQRVGRPAEAVRAYEAALDRVTNGTERRFLERRALALKHQSPDTEIRSPY